MYPRLLENATFVIVVALKIETTSPSNSPPSLVFEPSLFNWSSFQLLPEMPSYRWPTTGDDHPQDIAKHANCLKTEFDLVSDTAAYSLSRTAKLPKILKPSILAGIEKGNTQARKKGYCPKWSKVESIFRDVMLKNIATEAALQARDRIPMDQFNGLYISYNALHTKLVAQLPPTATSHQSVGADAPIQATSIGGLFEPSHVATTAVKLVQASGKNVNSPRERKDQDVAEKKSDDASKEEDESGEGTGEEEESEEEVSEKGGSKEEESKKEERKGQDAGHRQAVTDSKDIKTGSDSSEISSNDSSSDGKQENEDDGESDSDADCDNDEVQKIVKEDTVRTATEDTSGPSTIVRIEIQDQAAVNRMEDMKPSELLRSISSSLKNYLVEKHLSSAGVHVSAVSLLDSGDVNVFIRLNTRVGPLIDMDLKGWDQKFERTLIGSPVPTYNVLMHSVKTSGLVFRTRKEKSEIIRKLGDANRSIVGEDGVRPIIRNIYWATKSLLRGKPLATLVIEFMDSKQANQALARGLSWQRKQHGCYGEDEKGRLLRCSRCQAYGHLAEKCKAPYTCGKCAGPHFTKTCNSEIRKCASCGRNHRTGDKNCPEKVKAKNSLGFQNEDTSQATKPATEADRTPPSDRQRSTSAGRTQTEASMPSPVSLDAESAEDDVESESESKQPLPKVEMAKDNFQPESEHPLPEVETVEDNVECQSKQPLTEADSAQDASAELATLWREFEDFKKNFVALNTILQSKVSGGTKRRAGDAFVNGAGAESSGVAAKRIKNEESAREDSMGLYRQPSLYSADRPE